MVSLHEHLQEFKQQLEKGSIQTAYRGLLDYIMGLRTHFQKKYPDYSVSGSISTGYMDMTYFAFTPPSLKERNLKIAIVFQYETFCFEVWLAGTNRQFQRKYWKVFKESGWNQYYVVPITKRVDAIVKHVLVADPDFRDLDAMTGQIERVTLRFIEDVEGFLLKHEE